MPVADTDGADIRRPDATTAAAPRWLFVAAIGLSSFLLFALELLAGRLVLPVFGGAPSVWNTAMCFFTGVVFLGYLYAHVLQVRLGERRGGALHVGVAVLAVVAALLAPHDVTALSIGGLPAALNVLWVLAIVAGVPVFVLSTTTPLLSAWYARRHGDAWWLYAASNTASLVGLLAYPFLIEPNVGLAAQRVALEVAMTLLGVLLLALVLADRRSGGAAEGATARVVEAIESEKDEPGAKLQVLWVLAALVPAGLLSATSTYLATDLISAPMLWIGPLGVYLASFIVAFSERGRRVMPFAETLLPAAATLLWVPFVARVDWPVAVIVPVVLASYAVVAVVIHGRLALARPRAEYLTRFYLLVSLGGVLAMAFVALLAPLVFTDVYEYPLLLVAGLVVLAMIPDPLARGRSADRMANLRRALLRLAPYAAVCALLVASVARHSMSVALFVSVVLVVGAQVVLLGLSPRVFAGATVVAIVVLAVLFTPPRLARVRTFFGITEVRSDRAGQAVTEIHGSTLHGLQFTDEREDSPTSYFVRSGPLGDVMAEFDRTHLGQARIGVVGLGVGTIATYARAGDELTFFEIDRAVASIARDRHYFSYLADAKARPHVVLGDGRMSLTREPPATFDLLVLDAFSSDAVPAHLLTAEAMRTYARVLKPGGVMVFNATNRHYELPPAIAATARTQGLAALTKSYTPTPEQRDKIAAQPSRWVVVGRAADIAPLSEKGWVEPVGGTVLTDDYADMLRLLRWR